jgi:hypothetical protein
MDEWEKELEQQSLADTQAHQAVVTERVRRHSRASSDTETCSNATATTTITTSSGRGLPERDQALEADQALDVQHLLTERYWKRVVQALPDGSKTNRYAEVFKEDFWTRYVNNGTPENTDERQLGTIAGTVGPQLLAAITDAQNESPGKLKLYRGMSQKEAGQIKAWYNNKKHSIEELIKSGPVKDGKKWDKKEWRKALSKKGDPGVMPIGEHLGDLEQASEYKGVIMELTLKPGAHLVLFNPEYMALARSGTAPALIAQYFQHQKPQQKFFPKASSNEGKLAGYIGVKSENKGFFSLAVGSDASNLLLQLLVESIRVV